MPATLERFEGTIGRTHQDSTPWWPEIPTPREGSPNVLVILLDDTGFAHFGCYGSTIATPNVDRLATAGLRYTNFHTTALCSPTRACLLTGRNHHTVGMRSVSNMRSGFPHLRGHITKHAATVAQLLSDEGYGTYCVGKWHLTPMADTSAAGPFDQWPLQRGFGRFYGFLGGETDQFHPELTIDNHHVEAPAGPAEGYHLSEDLVDQAIGFLHDDRSVYPDRPFFMYLAFGATHAPHHAPADYMAKYRGRFDEGWDVVRDQWFARQRELGVVPADTVLAPRNPGVLPWGDLSDNERALACRLQEAFAAMLEHTDAQIGRLVEALEHLEVLDDTLIMVLSDNGASQEGGPTGVLDEMKFFNFVAEDPDTAVERLDEIGGPRSHSNYPWGWAQVGNTPGKRYKQNTHSGGIRDPLIISWPGGIEPAALGQVRTQFHHVIDLAPTLLELLGIAAPGEIAGVAQQPIEGTSLAYTFKQNANDAVAVPTQKERQYFEMFGHRAIWADGWKAVAFHRPDTSLDDDVWELYHLDEDFSECNDLAATQPERLADMVEMFWEEAERYQVLPIMDRSGGLFAGHPTPGTPRARDQFVYLPPTQRVPMDSAPALGSRSWTMRFEVERPVGDEAGVLLGFGTVNNGLVVYVDDDGHLVYDHNAYSNHTVVRSLDPVPVGSSVLEVHQDRVRRGPGRAHLVVDGVQVADVIVPLVPVMVSSIGMDIGRNPTGISSAYEAPYEFAGRLARVEIGTTRSFRPEEETAIELAAAAEMQ